MELLLRHNGIVPPIALNAHMVDRRNGPQGRWFADIPDTSRTHDDDLRDARSDSGRWYSLWGSRVPQFGVPLGRDQYGMFPRNHQQIDPRWGIEDIIVCAFERSRDFGIRVGVQNFKGHFNSGEFFSWLDNIEHFFEWKELLEYRKVKFVTLKLKRAALVWWREFQIKSVRRGKEKITVWPHMKEKLRRKYVPINYQTILYQRLLTLRQGSKSVQEYTEEFDLLTMQNAIHESDE